MSLRINPGQYSLFNSDDKKTWIFLRNRKHQINQRLVKFRDTMVINVYERFKMELNLIEKTKEQIWRKYEHE